MTYCNLNIRGNRHVLWFESGSEAQGWLIERGFWEVDSLDSDNIFVNTKKDLAVIFTPHNNDKPTAFSQVEKEIAS